MFIIYLFVPESPDRLFALAWCATHDHRERGKRLLQKIYGGNAGYDADRQYEILYQTVQHEKQLAIENKRQSWWNIFRGVDGLRTIISMFALLSQQFLGLSLFYTYSSYFFSIAGLSDPFQATVITNAVQLAIILLVVASVDKLGRRNICCSGLTILWFSNVAVGILGLVETNKATSSLLVTFSCIWVVGLQMSGSTGWGYVGETSAQRLRAYTAGFSAAISVVAGIVMSVLVPYMLNENEWNWNLKTAWFYAGVGLPFVIASWFLIPETARRSAAELDELFEAKVKPWRFHKTETSTQKAYEAQHATDDS
ncbi:hypothetical protein FFLO_05754 [Filobasidium floriforme]|uniref:Major facilitator superfamily (MFS) profile domain-containing protein n=1 Tax=Filobasidium floriforme TaxID=5210 RepID=A0A8K0NNJ3_9TREE|nr:hypothetical protein FFLO_05754 [Filobasidium floriforme]